MVWFAYLRNALSQYSLQASRQPAAAGIAQSRRQTVTPGRSWTGRSRCGNVTRCTLFITGPWASSRCILRMYPLHLWACSTGVTGLQRRTLGRDLLQQSNNISSLACPVGLEARLEAWARARAWVAWGSTAPGSARSPWR